MDRGLGLLAHMPNEYVLLDEVKEACEIYALTCLEVLKKKGRKDMLIGVFYHIDMELIKSEPQSKMFPLRCDRNQNYDRKVYTNNGRTATVYALQNGIKLEKGAIILVPDYLCISVLTPWK